MVLLSPTWWKKTAGTAVNLPTCDNLFSSKAVMYSINRESTSTNAWEDNPAYVPINNGGVMTGASTRLSNDSTSSSGFTRWICPSIFKHGNILILSNSLNIQINIYLGEDGPTPDGEFGAYPGTPLKKELLFTIPSKFLDVAETLPNPNYPDSGKFFTSDNLEIPMFSGHSYGYIFEMVDVGVLEVPSTPVASPTIRFAMSAAIYFGGAGQ